VPVVRVIFRIMNTPQIIGDRQIYVKNDIINCLYS